MARELRQRRTSRKTPGHSSPGSEDLPRTRCFPHAERMRDMLARRHRARDPAHVFAMT